MSKFLYLRLAVTNLRKNRRTYLPFLMASSLLTFTMYSFLMITFNPGLQSISGGMQFLLVLDFGAVVVGLFTAIFLFYANSYLIKRRKKEMALYSILGMEKKHVARVLSHELSLTWLVSMVVGLGLGVLLTRLLFLFVRLAIHMDVPLTGAVSPTAMWVTLVLFAALFILLTLYNVWQVRAASPAELLHGGQVGEREPKARWIAAVLGLATTGAGYWIAQSVDNPLSALALFFVAVVLVIIGTYLLFITGSVALLKLLKRRKRYYYSSKHFITISGLLYRMKQNAAGLASIAILCTMAMITLGTTVALYSGSEKMLSTYYPNDVLVFSRNKDVRNDVETLNTSLAAQTGLTVKDYHAFLSYQLSCLVVDGRVLDNEAIMDTDINDYDHLVDLLILTPDEYASLEGENPGLAGNEILYYSDSTTLPAALTANDSTYTLRRLDTLAVIPNLNNGSGFNRLYLIVPNETVAYDILAAAGEAEEDRAPVYSVQWNLSGDGPALDTYYAALKAGRPDDWSGVTLNIKANMREDWYMIYGGFLFMGIFLGLIFFMGTALILYFKQISEGIQDHDRFIILQKVGMSPEEVRATVRRQILLVFFLPLGVAVCHVAGSLHMMVQMLRLFGLTDVPYIALNTFLSAGGIAALYGLFYLRTARTYYNLVKF